MQRRIGDVLDLEVVEVTSHQVRLEFQRSEPQSGDRPEVTAFEVRPCLCRIDRRDVEQQAQTAFDLGETGVDIERRPKLLGRGCHHDMYLADLAGHALAAGGRLPSKPDALGGHDIFRPRGPSARPPRAPPR